MYPLLGELPSEDTGIPTHFLVQPKSNTQVECRSSQLGKRGRVVLLLDQALAWFWPGELNGAAECQHYAGLGLQSAL